MTPRQLGWASLSCLLVVAAAVAWWVWPRRPAVDPAVAVQLMHEANLAIAELENQDLAEAQPRLEAISEALPRDPFGPRNLTVAAILAIGEGPLTPAQLTTAVTALDRLATVEGQSAAFHWLSAKLALLAGDADAAAAAFAELVEVAPDDAAAWYGYWQALEMQAENAGDATTDTTAARAALQQACDADPRNLWLAVEWLRAVAIGLDQDLAADATLIGQVEDRWQAIAPFAPAVLAFTKTDVRAMLEKGIAAIQSDDTATASGTFRGLANLLVPQAAGDRAAVDPHPLEFVIERLSAEVRLAAASTATDAAIPVRYLPASVGAASAEPTTAVRLEDIDLDGQVDMVLLEQAAVAVLSRTGDDWQRSLTASLPEGCDGLLAVDLDLDFDEAKRQAEVAASSTAGGDDAAPTMRRCPAADLDLVAYGPGGLVCLENRLGEDGLSRTLEPLPVTAPIAQGAVRAAAAADLDADGPVDLVVADEAGLHLWINHGSQGFVEATPSEAMPATEMVISAILPIDVDRDIDIDLVICSDRGVGILENLRHGQFRYRGEVFDRPTTGVEVLDADADGRWDAVAAGPAGLWLIPDIAAPSADAAAVQLATDAADGVITVDVDNDGWLDLASWQAGAMQVWRGSPTGFAAADILPAERLAVRSLDTADIDGDGDLDLAVAGVPALLLDNDGGNANHWLAIDLEAQQIKGGDFAPSGRVNAHGLGSLLELKAGGLYQPRSVRRRTTHFGLGGLAAADAVRVLWLNGVPQNILQPQADLLICEQQILLGSCPYLYTWDGSGYRFVTDLLWAAPLGLQRSEGELMPDRPQEFISIPRGLLVEADGMYRMQITEELWEAAYFDEVRLLAIDHPPGVEVFSNEKVGPPDIAAFRLHTVAQRQVPIAARTGDGRDVLALVALEDGAFLPPSGRKLRQGLTEQSTLELDLGPLADPADLTLFLTGWMYPTTVSMNVALGRDPALGLPQPPSLAVPDGAGGWKTVLPMMGFPGGKTKTIAVDLSGLVPAGDPRVRIETSMEIAWDAIFFTSAEEPVDLVTHELSPAAADLHPRGFSRIIQPAGAGPEHFDYAQVDTQPKWPPMHGAFTRFGDVRDLLAAQDDRLVVMGSGDEITLAFAAPPLAQPGWERDFVLASFGWDKDANLATAAGDTSEPLPFAAMRSYPPAADDPAPDSEAVRAYRGEYQTRVQSDAFWQAIRRDRGQRAVGLSGTEGNRRQK